MILERQATHSSPRLLEDVKGLLPCLAGGLKATINNSGVSQEAKDSASERLNQM